MMGTSVEQRMAIRGRTGTRPHWHVSDLWKAPLTDLPIRDEILYQFAKFSPEMDLLEIGPGIREGSTFDKFTPPIHLAWTVLLFLMRLGGDCFERLPADDIFRKNLLVVATRAIEGGVPCSNLKTTSAV